MKKLSHKNGQKNKPVTNFYEQYKFYLVKKEGDVSYWRFNLAKGGIPFPSWVDRV